MQQLYFEQRNGSKESIMQVSHIEVWDNCLVVINKELTPLSFKTWFEPIKPVRFEQDVLTIQVPNKFFYEWLEQHYVDLLKKAIKTIIGPKAKLEYQILVRNIDETGKDNSRKESKPNEDENALPNSQEIKNPFVIPGIKKIKIDPQLNASYVFDQYIEGDCNRLARSAGMAVADRPGTTAFNPLVIYGSVGLGKTHLAHAIGNGIVQKFPEKNVLYVSMEKFSNQMIHAIKTNAVNDFLNFYQMLDVLIVDDIQFLANKSKTQEIFFHIFNQLHQNNKQIVLTSDRPPKDLSDMEDRLISRFKWGLTADLQSPDLETRMAILEAKMTKNGYSLPGDVVEYISHHIKENIRELEGVLISLIAQSSLNRKEIDITLAYEVIQKFVNNVTVDISFQSIQELVAEQFKIPMELLNSKTRKRNVVIGRQLSMYLSKQFTGKSLKTIGEFFGGKDHSTVIYSCNAIKDIIETDPLFRDQVSEIERKLRKSTNSSK
jgi:chromosomal replication initiator protein